MVRTLRALLVSGALALLLAGPAAANPSIVPNGRAATAVTDRDGVTHMVYDIPNGLAYDTVGYCRIPKGAQACQDTKELTYGNLACISRSRDSDDAYDNDFVIERPQVQISRFGEVFVLFPAFCSSGNTYVHDLVVWSSTDAGDTFDGGHRLGYLSIEQPNYSYVWTHVASILDAADRTVVSAIWSTGCGQSEGQPGAYVQSAPLGAYTSDRARMNPVPCDGSPTNGYGGRPAIVQRGKRSYVTAWTDEKPGQVQVRTYDKPDLAPSAVNTPDNWTPAVDPTPADTADIDYITDHPVLSSGPLGTFLLYRQREHDRHAGTMTNPHWLIRRVDGAALGPATAIPQPVGEEASFAGNRAQSWAGGVTVVQDEANGRLHYARFIPGTYAVPNFVQYLTSDDGVTWTPNTYLPAPVIHPGGDRDHDLGGFDDDWGQYDFDPVLAESTGINGFTGIVGESRGFADDGYHVRAMFPFGVLPLPYRDPPPTPGGPDPGTGGGGGQPPAGGGGGTPPPAPAPAPNPQDTRCRILQFAALDIIADACLTQDKGVYVAKGGVSVNGLKITGAEVRFDPKDLTVKTTGPVTVTVGATDIIKGTKIDWKLPKANTFDLGALDVGALGSKLFGFGLKGDVDVKLVRGAVEIKSHIGLPGILGGITADVTLRADNLAGLHTRELWVRFPSAKLGPLELADVEFNYNPEEDAWGGTLGLTLPPNPPGPKLKATIGFKDGEITDLGGELTLPGQGIAIEPTGIAWLTKIRAAMHRPPLTLKGGITIGGGPLLDSVTGERVVTVDGDITITLPDTGPSTFRADGQASIMGIPFATAYFQFVTDGQVSAGGGIKADFGPFSAKAGVDGWFNRRAFNIHGGAELCAGSVCVGGDVVFSSIGFAACADVVFTEIGAGIKWGDDLWAGLINPFWLLSHIDVMPVGCDVGPYEAKAAAAQATPGGERSVTFDKGLPSGFVAVIGQGAPPHVALVGPDGTRIEPSATTAVKTPGAFAFQSAKGNLTWFAVKAPKPGAYKIVPEADSVPIASVSTAKGLPQPKVTASVKRTNGAARILSYKIEPQPGQTVTFTEQGAKAGVGAALGKAKGSKGTLRFTPTHGPGGTRKIIALVAQNGMPRKELTVARYVAPAPPKPVRPKLTVKRVGTKLVVSWRKDAVARRWVARITLSDGRVIQLLPRKPTVTVIGVAKATTGRVAVYGETAAPVKGPTATATVRKAVVKKGKRG